MPRGYRDIKMYENEIIELKLKGKRLREIGDHLGFAKKQIYNFITRYNANNRKLEAGIALKKKGRPAKNSIVTEVDKISELKYILARKETKIRQLE